MFGPVAEGEGFLPPVSVSIKATVTHDTTRVSVTRLFSNDTDSPVPRASYTFPLPSGCTVVDFSCRIGRDTVLVGKVMPKAQARQTFDRALHRNQTAGTDIFTTEIGNIPGRTRLKATLSFIFLLKRGLRTQGARDCVALTLPSYIAPRYGKAVDNIDRMLGRNAEIESLESSVEVLAATDILDLISPSHPNTIIRIGAAACRR